VPDPLLASRRNRANRTEIQRQDRGFLPGSERAPMKHLLARGVCRIFDGKPSRDARRRQIGRSVNCSVK
jgi:hypothetical protein